MNIALLIVFIAIQCVDVWTTKKALGRGAEEANVVAGPLFKKLGFWQTVLLIKGVVIIIAAVITLYVSNAWIFTGGLVLIGLYVLWNNFRVLKQQKRY